MKTLIIAAALAASAALAPRVAAQEFRAVVPGGPIVRDARIYEVAPTEGALQAAARGGNVLQAINPAAPAQYQSDGKFVATAQGDPFIDPNLDRAVPYGVVLVSLAY